MRPIASFLFSLCLISGGVSVVPGCGAADETETGVSTDEFHRGRHVYHRHACSTAFRACLLTECRDETAALRAVRPFSRDWFAKFHTAKGCAVRECATACRSGWGAGGTGGAGGSGGNGASAGNTGSAGSAGTNNVCSQAADACQSCLCSSCETDVTACQKDSACAEVLRCGTAASCTGVDCYFNPDGSRGPCADVIDGAGGPASASVASALQVFRCAEQARPDCRVCTQ